MSEVEAVHQEPLQEEEELSEEVLKSIEEAEKKYADSSKLLCTEEISTEELRALDNAEKKMEAKLPEGGEEDELDRDKRKFMGGLTAIVKAEIVKHPENALFIFGKKYMAQFLFNLLFECEKRFRDSYDDNMPLANGIGDGKRYCKGFMVFNPYRIDEEGDIVPKVWYGMLRLLIFVSKHESQDKLPAFLYDLKTQCRLVSIWESHERMHNQFSPEEEDDSNIPKLERTLSEPLPVDVLAGNKTSRADQDTEDDAEKDNDKSPIKRTRSIAASYIS